MKKTLFSLLSFVLLSLATNVSAQVQTVMSGVSMIRAIPNIGVPIKSIAKGNDTIVSLVEYSNVCRSSLQISIDGSANVISACFNDRIKDFDIEGDTIYFCGYYGSTGTGFFAYAHINDLFMGNNTTWKTLQEGTITKIDVFADISGNRRLAMITEDNEILDYNFSNTLNSYDKYSGITYKLLDIVHTRNFVCAIGSNQSLSQGDNLHLFIYDFNTDTTLYEYEFNTYTYMIYSNYIFTAEITALRDNTNVVVVGTQLLNSRNTYTEFDVINLNNIIIADRQLIEHSLNGRPEVFDLEYNPSSDKVLCLSHNLDIGKDIIFEMDPYANSSYSIPVIIPNVYQYVDPDINYDPRHYLKNIAFYDDEYYTVCGCDLSRTQLIFDKRYNIFSESLCYELEKLEARHRTIPVHLIFNTITTANTHCKC